MTDIAALFETFDLACHICGRAGADTFGRAAELEAQLAPPVLPAGVAVQMSVPFGVRTIGPGDLAPFLPAHRRCLNPPKERPEPKRPPYDLTRSVA